MEDQTDCKLAPFKLEKTMYNKDCTGEGVDDRYRLMEAPKINLTQFYIENKIYQLYEHSNITDPEQFNLTTYFNGQERSIYIQSNFDWKPFCEVYMHGIISRGEILELIHNDIMLNHFMNGTASFMCLLMLGVLFMTFIIMTPWCKAYGNYFKESDIDTEEEFALEQIPKIKKMNFYEVELEKRIKKGEFQGQVCIRQFIVSLANFTQLGLLIFMDVMFRM